MNVATGDGNIYDISGVFDNYYHEDGTLHYHGEDGVDIYLNFGLLPTYYDGGALVSIYMPINENDRLDIQGLRARNMDTNPAGNNDLGMNGTYVVRDDSPELWINDVSEKNEGIALTVDGPNFVLAFEDGGKEYELNGYFISAEEYDNGFYTVAYFKGYSGYPNFAYFAQDLSRDRYSLYMGWDNGTDHFWWEAGYLDKAEEPSEPQDYNVNILGNGLSNTSEYMISIVGNIQGTFDEGANVLTGADIQAQNLSITSFNLTNGANRVMGISTVEGITVTVTNGTVTNVEVKGRAQTNPGNFDRYTVNCNTF